MQAHTSLDSSMPFPSRRGALLAVNLLGGTAVLGSYLWGMLARPDAFASLWGGVPEALRPVYTVNMLLAAGGYFLFTHYLAFRLPTDHRVGSRPGLPLVTLLYLMVLVGSALWLPLTVAVIDHPSTLAWWAVRLVLSVVGLASLGLLTVVLSARPVERGRIAALVGAIPFCIQTALLDATIWPLYFPAP